MFKKIGIVASILFTVVKSEGYYCPYTDLGANGDNILLYDYYNTNNGYWTRTGETGWQTLESYCADKADSSKHSDAGEWKCNDSYQLCSWTGSSCAANRARQPDCKPLCQAILNNQGPACLGNCPGGQSNDNMHMQYCGWSIPKSPGQSVPILPPSSTQTSIPSAIPTQTSNPVVPPRCINPMRKRQFKRTRA